MRKLTLTLSAPALALSLNSVADAKVYMPEKVSDGVTVAQLAEQHAIHWISVEQIEESLKGQPPMAVGFDIDDTVLFSSGLYRGKLEYSPNDYSYLKTRNSGKNE